MEVATLRASLVALKSDHDALARRKAQLEETYASLMKEEGNAAGNNDSQLRDVRESVQVLMQMEADLRHREVALLNQYGEESVHAMTAEIQEGDARQTTLPNVLPVVEPTLQQQPQGTYSSAIGPVGQPMDALQASIILCCKCNLPTAANETRLCFECLKAEANITEGISELNSVNYCKSCERYESKPTWLRCEWESKELLALCLRKVKKPKECRLVSAEFIWTESHCRRIKVKLGVERELFGATLRQYVVVTYVVGYKQCEECTKSVTPHLWVSNLQVRQRRDHKRTMLFLEQLILKSNAHEKCINIVDLPDGMDFHFSKPQHAATLVQFIRSSLCVRVHPIATQLVSHDAKSNTYHNKYVQLIDLCPICRDDLVFLPKRTATALGGVSQIMLCRKITTGVHLIDPFTLRGVDLDNEKYWRNEFEPILSRINLCEFIVLNVELCSIDDIKKAGVAGRFLTGMMATEDEKSTVKRAWGQNSSFKLAEVEIARLSDFGKNDERMIVRTHLGHLLTPGTLVLGYDLQRSNIKDSNEQLNECLSKLAYDVILVKKQPVKAKRNWVLKTLPKTLGGTEATQNRQRGLATRQDDIEAFKEEIEEDGDMRQNITIYKDPRSGAGDVPGVIALSELMEGLTLDDDVI